MRYYDIDSLDNRDPVAIARFARLVEGLVLRWHPHHLSGMERIPEGPSLFVANHSGGIWTPDSYMLGWAIYKTLGLDRMPYGLAHEVILSQPPVNQILCPLGVVRASHDNALRIFAAGRSALVYPGGDYDAMRPYSRKDEVVFGDRRGYIRLALTAGVPIVPVATVGAHEVYRVLSDMRWLARLIGADRWARLKVMPLTLSFPLGLTLGPVVPFIANPTDIRQEFLPPIYFDRSGPEAAADEAYVAACSARVQGTIQIAMTRMADARRMAKLTPGGRPPRGPVLGSPWPPGPS
ncbi:MAG: acyltransferase family protein [Myxococcales bacterium]|nr:acyltransferase family protein [Myxococcales bacterium]